MLFSYPAQNILRGLATTSSSSWTRPRLRRCGCSPPPTPPLILTLSHPQMRLPASSPSTTNLLAHKCAARCARRTDETLSLANQVIAEEEVHCNTPHHHHPPKRFHYRLIFLFLHPLYCRSRLLVCRWIRWPVLGAHEARRSTFASYTQLKEAMSTADTFAR
jgi:hypothetical protein